MRVYDGKAKREGEVLKDQTDPTTGRWLLIRWDGHYGEPQWVDAGLVTELISEEKTADYENYERAGYTAPTETYGNIRTETLAKAAKLISTERDQAYGDPVDNFQRIADLWNAFLGPPHNIKAFQVAILMSLVKFSRMANDPSKEDNWIDVPGYAGLGWEVYVRTSG